MTQSLPSRGLQLLIIPRIHSPFIPFSKTTFGLYLGIWHPGNLAARGSCVTMFEPMRFKQTWGRFGGRVLKHKPICPSFPPLAFCWLDLYMKATKHLACIWWQPMEEQQDRIWVPGWANEKQRTDIQPCMTFFAPCLILIKDLDPSKSCDINETECYLIKACEHSIRPKAKHSFL